MYQIKTEQQEISKSIERFVWLVDYVKACVCLFVGKSLRPLLLVIAYNTNTSSHFRSFHHVVSFLQRSVQVANELADE